MEPSNNTTPINPQYIPHQERSMIIDIVMVNKNAHNGALFIAHLRLTNGRLLEQFRGFNLFFLGLDMG